MDVETKTCQNCKQDFTIEQADFDFYKKIDVPAPTWCPQCRIRRRLMFRNERKLYRAKDAITGEPILALFPPEAGYTIYRDAYWWDSAKWDPLEFGQEFDETRPFLQQLMELDKRVPKYQSASIRMVNSEYSANADGLKNCYLLFNSNHTEDSAYGNGVDFSKNCFDNSHVQKSDRCYGSFWLTNCYDTHFSSQCDDCTSTWFSKNCRGCTNCFGCVNLRNKNYCFFNEQLTKDEYTKRLAALKLDTWSGLTAADKKARQFWLTLPIKFLQGVQNTNVSGDFITHSKNVYRSYLIRECEDLRYCQYSQVPSSRDCMDGSLIGSQAELIYEGAICGWGASNLKFCWECWEDARDLEYCIYCSRGSANLFGCVSVTKKQYCILNKQYSKEDYFALRKKIIAHMNAMPYVDKQGRVYKYGEFFPVEFSPFTYNQAVAAEHFPATKEEALAFGARWQDPNPTEYQTTMTAAELPDAIGDVQDGILKQIIQCEQCKKAYRIIAPELQFLKQVKIALPRTCVDCRHTARISQRNRAVFYDRQCMKPGCPNQFVTSSSPDSQDIVYCEQCYNAEVI